MNGQIIKVEQRNGNYNGKDWHKIVLHCVMEDNTVKQIHTREEDLKVFGIEDLKKLTSQKWNILSARLYQNNYESLIGLQ